jgi:hypothetical protein
MLFVAAAVVTCLASPVSPVSIAPDLVALYEAGQPFAEFVAGAEARQELWETNAAEATVPDDVAARVSRLDGRYRLLAVAAASCLDSAWSIPWMAALADMAGNIDLRVVSPGEGGQEVMDARLTPDGRAATPTVVVLNEGGEDVGCWIERPARQRDFYLANLKDADRQSDARRAALQDFLAWYQADSGASALRELMDVLEAAENGAGGCG